MDEREEIERYGRPLGRRRLAEIVNPDRRRAEGRIEILDRGRALLWIIEVQDKGVMCMRASSDDETGRLVFNGVSIFTWEQVRSGAID